MKILYLEDNKIDADLTRMELKKAIPESVIEVAETIAIAKILLKKNSGYDLALLDLNLPDGNGVEILNEIREKNIPAAVIILTSSGNEEAAIAALKAGADDYLPKNQGYLEKLPILINIAIDNFRKNYKRLSRPLKVLYVEWHKADVDLTERHMKDYAPFIHLDSVFSSDEALNLLPNSPTLIYPYDVLLMDYRLPGLNALDTIKIIRQERKLTIPIVLVSGHGNEEIAVQALKLGADEYIVKRENYLFRLPSIILSAFQKHELENKQLELSESESKYRLLADNSADVIFILNLEMKYTYVSPAVKTLRGFDVDEVMKQDIPQVLAPDSVKKALFMISKMLPPKNQPISHQIDPIVLELEMKKKDGSTVWTEVKISLITENNFPVGILGVTRDISKRKKATDELKVLSRAIEQSPASVVITDINGDIKYVNPKFTEVTGYAFDEVIGKNPRVLKSGDQPAEVYTALWKTISSGNEWFGEFLNKRKDGTLFWENASISPVKNEDGKVTHFIAVKEDITEKKKYIEELIDARDKAQESDRLKSAFLATMSHELRTPLNAVIGFSDLINDSMDKAEIIEISKVINKSGHHLLSIIEDIFEISLLQTKKTTLNVEEFRLSELILMVENFAQKELIKENRKNLSLRVQSDESNLELKIHTDMSKIFQVLNNLIKNAIEFTEAGSIEIGYAISGKDITFFVKDTGIGIPKNKLGVIFELFRQVDDSFTRKHGGVGIGLTICSELAKLLNGKLWVESKEGFGSTFYFKVPGVIDTGEQKQEIEKDKRSNIMLSGKTILIVEDVESNYLLLKNYILLTGAKTLWAKTGEESVELCRKNPSIDLVLMDILLPGIDGYEATNRIKEIRPGLKIIIQTALAMKDDRDRAAVENCDDYITKPIRMDDFIELLNKYLK
jgi:PAS domain S-box-containing protein